MKIHIQHDSVTGQFQNKTVIITDALIDFGFELHKKRYTALKLVTAKWPYFVIGLQQKTLESIVEIVRSGKTYELTIPHAAFDVSITPDEEVHTMVKKTLNEYFEELPLDDYINTDAFDIFYEFEKNSILTKHFHPIWRKNHNKIVPLWARTLPTYDKPLNISKYQYFEQVFQNSHPPHYRQPFWRLRREQ